MSHFYFRTLTGALPEGFGRFRTFLEIIGMEGITARCVA